MVNKKIKTAGEEDEADPDEGEKKGKVGKQEEKGKGEMKGKEGEERKDNLRN